LLLAIFLFNVTGYYFMQQLLLNKSDKQLALQLDQKRYDPQQLIELRVPINMPYYQNTGFQRHDGHIMIKGVDYNYVERKVENGYLILRCIQNEATGKIRQNTGDYFAKANGIEKSGGQKSGSSKTSVKITIDDFEEHLFQSSFDIVDKGNSIITRTNQSFAPQQYLNRCEQPPDTKG